VEKIILDGELSDGGTVLVDIGAGHGHDLIEFLPRFQHVKAKRILVFQDLPAMIKGFGKANKTSDGIEAM
jgi:hypothetical protein